MTGHTARSKRKSKLEPISLAELAETPGMSGFCTFLTRGIEEPVPVLDGQRTETATETPRALETPPVGNTIPVSETALPASAPEADCQFPVPGRDTLSGLDTGGVLKTSGVNYTPLVLQTEGVSKPPIASESYNNKDTHTGPLAALPRTAPVLPVRSVEPKAPTATKPAPLPETPILLETPPVVKSIPTRSAQIARRFQPLENARLRRAVLAQDGHTMAEQIIYSALYNAGQGIAPYRDVAVGNRWIMARTGLSERTVQLNLKSLQLKLSIEIIRRHNPDTNEPTVFRVYSFESILERRRAAGLDLVAKKRGGGVRLVSSHTAPALNTPPVFDPSTEFNRPLVPEAPRPPASNTAQSPVSDTAYLGNSVRNGEESTSSGDHRIIAALRQYGPVDDEGVRHLLDRCRTVAADCTVDEILYFIHEKLGTVQLRTGPLAFLMVALPRCLEGESFRQFREQRRLQREAEAARDAEIAREILAAPDSGAEELAWAREVLLNTAQGPSNRSKPS